jgi:hypothetical protein
VFRAALIRLSLAFATLLAGIIVSVLGNGTTVLFVIGLALVGLGAVGLASLFFYEVGRSEDRERDRERTQTPRGH